MNLSKIVALTCVVALTASPMAIGAGNTYVYGNVSGWTVRTDPNHGYRCFTEARYEGDTLIRLGFNSADSSLYVSVSVPAWSNVDEGGRQSAQLMFDNEIVLDISAVGMSIGSGWEAPGLRMTIPAETQESFIRDFMARHAITVTIGNIDPVELSLAGSHGATRLLQECQSSMARENQHSD
jgi:hypothetical protein